ncbi:hypothetical protein QTO34_016753 [Cnephaeus nilssonii]|uniref:Uncharacterized protein n=1 Tax=Cnephaeus nilssonii TaxID=3371016 RepID=A0AA40LQK8_CNENI|nr:hypothetical protein QTO34_016753 [Eptesicus nilssonii]
MTNAMYQLLRPKGNRTLCGNYQPQTKLQQLPFPCCNPPPPLGPTSSMRSSRDTGTNLLCTVWSHRIPRPHLVERPLAPTSTTLNTGEKGIGTSQAQMSSQERNGDQPGCSPGEGRAAHPVVLGTNGCTCACTCDPGERQAAHPTVPGTSACGCCPGEGKAARPMVLCACGRGLGKAAHPRSPEAAAGPGKAGPVHGTPHKLNNIKTNKRNRRRMNKEVTKQRLLEQRPGPAGSSFHCQLQQLQGLSPGPHSRYGFVWMDREAQATAYGRDATQLRQEVLAAVDTAGRGWHHSDS